MHGSKKRPGTVPGRFSLVPGRFFARPNKQQQFAMSSRSCCLEQTLAAAAGSHLLVPPSLRLLSQAQPIQGKISKAACNRGQHRSLRRANKTSSDLEHAVLILHTDSRPPQAGPEAYWSVSAAANAQYAHLHGYDFVYAILPESTRFFRGGVSASLDTKVSLRWRNF